MIQQEGSSVYPSILESQYGLNNYFVLNFNDVLSSLGTLYLLLFVNNMQIVASGFTCSSYDLPVRIFFVSWYIIGVLLFLNLLTASLLSSFIYFWVVRKTDIDEPIFLPGPEKDIDAPHDEKATHHLHNLTYEALTPGRETLTRPRLRTLSHDDEEGGDDILSFFRMSARGLNHALRDTSKMSAGLLFPFE
jgi:hypothetical protein